MQGMGKGVTRVGHEQQRDGSNRYSTIEAQGVTASWAASPTGHVHGADGA